MKQLLLSLALLLPLLLPVSGWAVRLQTTGIEEGNVGITTNWNTNVGSVGTASTTSPHSGTYKFSTVSTAAISVLRRALTNHTSGTLYTRFYFETSVAPAGDTIMYEQMRDDAITGGLRLTLLTTGAVKLTNVVSGTTVTSSTILSVNTWYRFELEHLVSDTVGTMTLRLYAADSTTITETLAITAEDTLPTNIGLFYFGKNTATNTVVFSYDDIVINDAIGGGVFGTWPGPGKIYLLIPDSNVSMQWETSAGAADSADFSTIDDLPGAANDADYNAADTTLDALDALGNIDRLGLTNPGAEVTSDATIISLAVYGRVGSSQTSATHLRLNLWDEAASLTNGPSATCNVNGWRIMSDTEVLVYNASGKTKANLNSFNAGYEDITDVIAARPRRISALWVNVEWIEASGAGGAILQNNSGFLGAIIK